MTTRSAHLLLLLAGAVWGMGFIAQATVMDDIGPLLFTGIRFLLAGVIVLPFAWREQKRTANKLGYANILTLLPIGIIFFFALVLQQFGLITTTVTNAGFLTALYVLFVPMILFLVLGEKQPKIIWPAALIAIVGIFLLSGGAVSALKLGDWLVIAGAIFGAIHVILVGRFAVTSGAPFTMATAQFLICGILGIVGFIFSPLIGMAEETPNITMLSGALPEILYAGIFSGALAFSLQAIGQQYTRASAAAILLSSESLFAALFGAIILGERLTPYAYLGGGLIFLALVLIELKPGEPLQDLSENG